MKFNRRRAVSPVIEALLVSAIALGAGGMFYGFYSGLLGTASQQAAITVQQLSLSVGTNGAVFSITLKNGGNVPFTSTVLKGAFCILTGTNKVYPRKVLSRSADRES